MLFILNSQGTIINSKTEPVNQGAINVNEIFLIAPFTEYSSVVLTYKLPNGIIGNPIPMTPLLSQVQSVGGVDYNVWHTLIDYPLTQVAGDLTLQFLVYFADGSRLPSSATTIRINVGNDYIVPDTDVDTWDEISTAMAGAVNSAKSALSEHCNTTLEKKKEELDEILKGSVLNVNYDKETHNLTVSLNKFSNGVIASCEVDLLEEIQITGATYDEEKNEIVISITDDDVSEIRVPIYELVDGLATKEQLSATQKQLSATQKQIEANQKQIEATQKQIEENHAEVADWLTYYAEMEALSQKLDKIENTNSTGKKAYIEVANGDGTSRTDLVSISVGAGSGGSLVAREKGYIKAKYPESNPDGEHVVNTEYLTKRLGALCFSVVTDIPDTPDENTIYFITGE